VSLIFRLCLGSWRVRSWLTGHFDYQISLYINIVDGWCDNRTLFIQIYSHLSRRWTSKLSGNNHLSTTKNMLLSRREVFSFLCFRVCSEISGFYAFLFCKAHVSCCRAICQNSVYWQKYPSPFWLLNLAVLLDPKFYCRYFKSKHWSFAGVHFQWARPCIISDNVLPIWPNFGLPKMARKS